MDAKIEAAKNGSSPKLIVAPQVPEKKSLAVVEEKKPGGSQGVEKPPADAPKVNGKHVNGKESWRDE
jgi:hypothetical protein